MALVQIAKNEWVNPAEVIRISPPYTSFAEAEILLTHSDKTVYSDWPADRVAAAVGIRE